MTVVLLSYSDFRFSYCTNIAYIGYSQSQWLASSMFSLLEYVSATHRVQ